MNSPIESKPATTTVAELIEQLKKYPPEVTVWVMTATGFTPVQVAKMNPFDSALHIFGIDKCGTCGR